MGAVEGAEEESCATDSGGEWINVRVGLPGDKTVSVAHHLRGNVCVQVERPHHRYVRAHDGAHCRQEISLHVIDFRRNRRPVQRQQNAVHGQGIAEIFQ